MADDARAKSYTTVNGQLNAARKSQTQSQTSTTGTGTTSRSMQIHLKANTESESSRGGWRLESHWSKHWIIFVTLLFESVALDFLTQKMRFVCNLYLLKLIIDYIF